jgi:acyl-CoA dehydrogenase family member 9
MASESFMARLYRGEFDRTVFESFKPVSLSRDVETFTAAFAALLREFPPQEIEARGSLPRELLDRMAQHHLFGLSIPKAYGGQGLGIGAYMKAVEQLAARDMAMALCSLAHLSIGVKGIELFGTESQKRKYLIPAASGEMIFSYALTEPKIGSDAQHIETAAELAPDGGCYLLNGQKAYITNANYAGAMTVFAQMDPTRPGFMGAFIVEAGWDGVKIGKDIPKMGLKASSTAAIQFRDVRVPVENMIGRPGEGFKIAMVILNYGRLALAAAALGMMRQSLEDMTKRASTRIQFGVPIGTFPLIQEKLARTRVNTAVATATNEFTAGLLQQDPTGNFAIETSHCKLFGTTRAWQALYDALQVAGGAGYLATHPYEKRMRDFRVATVFEGTTEIHSMYPALSALRSLSQEVTGSKRSTLSRIAFLMHNAFRRTPWPLEFSDQARKGASMLARSNAAAIRRMLPLGLLWHGKEVFTRQFFLRRITTLSLYLYGIIALLAKLKAQEKEGTLSREDEKLLEYFVQEAREVRAVSARMQDTPLERLTPRIARRN